MFLVRCGEPSVHHLLPNPGGLTWRDLIAVRTHYLLARDRTANNVGRLMVGLEPTSRN